MSLSCPESPRKTHDRGGLVLTAALAGALCALPAHAAQTYWQPEIEASVEQNTNRNLAIDPDLEQDIHGYSLAAGILWGYVTPTSETRLLPRVRLQHFPDDDDAERTEQFFDFSTVHRPTERTSYDLVGGTRGKTRSGPSSAGPSSTISTPRTPRTDPPPASSPGMKRARGCSFGRASITSGPS
jgi:hypothetical protein